MKALGVAAVFLISARMSFAQWAVIDAANLSQSVTNYAIMVQQVAKQAEQITNQVQQIRQMEDQLKRLGNMADIKAVVGFPEFRLDLTLPTQIRTWADTVARVNGTALFGDSRGGVYTAVQDQYPTFDGTMVVRTPDLYKPPQEITADVDQFKLVQTDVYARREQLKKVIAETSDALQNAQTDAEEKKLSAVLQAQYSELAALDSEVSLSADEIQVRAAESSAMAEAQRQADAEIRGRLAQEEAKKLTTAFKPIYGSVLEYVTERPYR